MNIYQKHEIQKTIEQVYQGAIAIALAFGALQAATVGSLGVFILLMAASYVHIYKHSEWRIARAKRRKYNKQREAMESDSYLEAMEIMRNE